MTDRKDFYRVRAPAELGPSSASGRVASYSCVRYFFTNYSQDIRRIFSEHCEQLGIRVTQSNHRNLTGSHRDSVALLDEFVGPKS